MNLVEALAIVLNLAEQGKVRATYDDEALEAEYEQQEEALEKVQDLMNHRGKPNQFLFMREREYRNRLYDEYELTQRLEKALETSRIEQGVAERNLSVAKSQLSSTWLTVGNLRDKIATMELATSPKVVKLIQELAVELKEVNDD